MPHSRQPAPRLHALGLITALLLGGAPAAQAAPDAPQRDLMLQLLRERGLAPAAPEFQATALVRQVRDSASELVIAAMNFLGVPYRRGGGSSEEGFDCSGFTRFIFENSLGLVLPRRADEQAQSAALLQVQRDELQPGDLVFFNTLRRAFSHVGIYMGEGKFIHAPRAGAQVRIEDMRSSYWARRYNGARRAETVAHGTSAQP